MKVIPVRIPVLPVLTAKACLVLYDSWVSAHCSLPCEVDRRVPEAHFTDGKVRLRNAHQLCTQGTARPQGLCVISLAHASSHVSLLRTEASSCDVPDTSIHHYFTSATALRDRWFYLCFTEGQTEALRD